MHEPSHISGWLVFYETQEKPVTQLLEDAFAKAAKLPAQQQDELAALILAELSDEERWDQAFLSSQDTLARLADEALAEHKRGEAEPLDLEKL